ncbi:MAG: DNA mismatch repair protein MutL [Candidatus Saganbacteria bacterium]|uniref:DNA mismatch repair protein MutL n=1 Tax=Candidatus Saganbacteria bacterium TaxID=2575572 RepID=A0A833L0B5_UNCSA|nr:MAG: DNA mismatch repair protein MutL [Candidatus Saganbacteria bacterium]
MIKLLPEELINKIAAGEVIERPASVVKELIENSIDAGASKIKVEIQKAGTKLILVSDNGLGMAKEELSMAVERHSTSKIQDFDDLFNIHTLGFRGEALPSIASVSKFEMISKKKDALAGNVLSIEGGKILSIGECGAPNGTTVSIKDLFFNTPARKKFLKSDTTEINHITDYVLKYSLSYPNISFELISDGNIALRSPGSGSLKDALASAYGVDFVKGLISVSQEFGFGKISGFISPPSTSRIDKSYEIFFVNNRYIHNFLLNRALEEAYRNLIPGMRYPIGIIFIDIDPKLIDINVHPAKREVKFQNTKDIMDAIKKTAASGLNNLFDKPAESPYQAGQNFGEKWEPAMADILFPNDNFQLPQTKIELDISSVQPLIPLYQLKETYIIATDGIDMVVIDQHAAHERIIYDKLLGGNPVSQPLLVPANIELGIKESTVLKNNLKYFLELGFELEEFGGNTFILRATPQLPPKINVAQIIIDAIAELLEIGESTAIEQKKDNLKKSIACHSAVRAGDKLTDEEINQLIKDLYSTKNPLTCPHGRPTMIRITHLEFEKSFMR